MYTNVHLHLNLIAQYILKTAVRLSKSKYALQGFLIALILGMLSQGYVQMPIKQIYANNSPSFVRQEITDSSGDWIFWKGNSSTAPINTHDGKLVEINKANDVSECKTNNDSFPPDIRSVSYISDGKDLNSTIWLSSPFEEPQLNDTIDIFQEEVKVTISNNDLTLTQFVERNMVNISHIFNPSFGIEANSTIIAGKQAHKVVYNDKRNELRVMQLWTIDGDKAYNITYSAMPGEYDSYYLRNIKHMVDTFELRTFDNEKSTLKRSKTNFLPYEGHGIRIEYPVDWNKTESTNAEFTDISFRSPFDDKREPSWHEITITMAIDVDSVHDAGTDYRVIHSRIPNNYWTGNWSRQLARGISV